MALDLARRWGWHVAEQAALEVDRTVQLGRPIRSRRGLARHLARCFARPEQCHRRHRGVCGETRLNLYRGRRLDENLEQRANPQPPPTPAPAILPVSTVPNPDQWPTDPEVTFAEAAAGGPPAVVALAARLTQRFGNTPNHNTNPQPPEEPELPTTPARPDAGPDLLTHLEETMPNTIPTAQQPTPAPAVLFSAVSDSDRPDPDPRIVMLRQLIEGLEAGSMNRATALGIVEAANLGGTLRTVRARPHPKT